VNQLLKLNFAVNQPHLCKALFGNIERGMLGPDLDPPHGKFLGAQFPASQRATYFYYCGRYSVYQDEFREAQKHMHAAAVLCRAHACAGAQCAAPAAGCACRQLQRVLAYLVPVNLLMGRMPAPQLLQRHGLQRFQKLQHSVEYGSLHEFNEAMAENQLAFIKAGLYLALEKLRSVVMRNLMKRICGLLVEQGRAGTKGRQFDLENHVLPVVRWLEPDFDLEDLECCVVNLVHGGYLKGYISYTTHKLVTAEQAFPAARLKVAPTISF